MIVIYHASCVDGFTAAWACWRKFGDDAEYIAANYGDDPPAPLGRDIVIVDFSYPRRVLEYLGQVANSLLVLDHHKTAQADLEGLTFCKFDMARSGAGMAWDELIGGERPKIINYVEDRDLWRWNLPRSRDVSAWLSSWSRGDFQAWQLLADDLENDFPTCVSQGNAILRALDGYVDFMANKSRICAIGEHRVPVINTTYGASELIGNLSEKAIELGASAPFAAGWFETDRGTFVYSLRSRGEFDVSEVAKQFGGGGHKNAAGFTVNDLVHR